MSPALRIKAAPPINPPTPRMIELDARAQPLEAELDQLRSNVGIFRPANDRVRELRRMLASIDREHTTEFKRANPEWVRFWNTNPSTPTERKS